MSFYLRVTWQQTLRRIHNKKNKNAGMIRYKLDIVID